MYPIRLCVALVTLSGAGGALRAQEVGWTSVPTPTAQTLWGVAYGNGRFVAVGEGGAIVYSDGSDGTRWTAALSITNRWLVDIGWSQPLQRFVAVGDAGTILTSADGVFWSPQSSGTTQRLNSVLWGGGKFLVVGENGTALTSPDAIAWTPRATGDTGWLRGLAYGNGRFVVTGHDATVLTSVDGGTVFQRAFIATAAHLDAAIFTGDRFYVTGSDLVLGSSFDGITWNFDPNINADGRENGVVYNGLVFFNNTLLAVGDRGRIRDQFGGAWNSSSITTDWRAVTATTYTVVAVGTQGRTAYTHIGSAGYRISASGSPYVGRRVTLHADLYGQPATPFNSQWSVNNQPIAGATGETLVLDPAALTDIGNYSFTSSVANGSVIGSFQLSLYSGPTAEGLVDKTFSPALSSRVDAVAPLADGRVYVAGRGLRFSINGRSQDGLARLNADGSVDAAFNCGAGLTLGLNTPCLYLQPDGRLAVWAKFTRIDGAFATPLARYNSDGTRDATFAPDSTLLDTQNPPILLADGRWLSVKAQTAASGYRVLALARFNANGGADAAYGSRTATVSFDAPVGQSGNTVLSAIDAQGRVYVGVPYGFAPQYPFGAGNGRTALVRFNPDGTPDPGFPSRSFAELRSLQATPQGIIIQQVEWQFSRPIYTKWTTTTKRLRFDGTEDPGFSPIVTELGPYGYSESISRFGPPAVLADGSIVMASVAARARRGLVRFDSGGDFDPNFSVELGADAFGLSQVPPIPLPNGQLLIAGDFTSFQGEARPYLVRLTPDTRAGATHLANLSVRSNTGAVAGGEALILGYVTTGGDTSLLARAAGPALAPFGVTDLLADPQLGVFSGSTLIAGNDDWGSGPAAFLAATATRVGAFPFPDGSRDAALYAAAPAGAYTIQIVGKNDATGVALAELYDATPAPVGFRSPRVTNLSVRANAGSGASTLIAGLAVTGNSARNFLIRAAGPALGSFGLPNFLRDPVLTLFRGDTAIAANDNWDTPMNRADFTADQVAVSEAMRIVGAFSFSAGRKDAALFVTLPPGLYTAQVTSADGSAGIALIEVYEIP